MLCLSGLIKGMFCPKSKKPRLRITTINAFKTTDFGRNFDGKPQEIN